MKRSIFLCSIIFCFICIKADYYDQQYFGDANTIKLEKPGSLAKGLGKDVESITCLQVKGELSDKDMKALAKLSNLRRLSLRYANLAKTKDFPVFQNLEVLFLPNDQHIPIEYMDKVPANKKLKVLLFCSFLDIQPRGNNSGNDGIIGTLSNLAKSGSPERDGKPIRFAPFESLEKVIISSMLTEQNSLDYQKYGVAGYTSIPVDTVIYLCQRLENHQVPIVQQFSAKYYEGDNEHLFYVGNGKIDFSTLQAVRAPYSSQGKFHIPAVLDLNAMTYVEKGFFNNSDVEEITFSANSYLNLQAGAFKGAKKLRKVTFGNSLRYVHIYPEAFADCPALDTIIFDCPATLERTSISNYKNLKAVIFNQKANIKNRAFCAETIFGQTASIAKVIFNGDTKISSNGFQYVDEIIFNTMPSSLPNDFAICNTIQIPNVVGANDMFLSIGIAPECLIDPSANLTFDIIVTEPGNILKFLPLDKLTQIKSLTITGHLYDIDIEIIKQCTNLKYLNLKEATISESEQGRERRRNSFIIGDFELSYMPDCYIPTSAFAGMQRLNEVILPSTVKRINGAAFNGCRALEKVDLGIELEEIGHYAFAETKLKDIIFPNSLKIINGKAFDKVSTLGVIDLSNCYMEKKSNCLSGGEVNANIGCLPNVEVLYMPNGMTSYNPFVTEYCSGLKEVYLGKDVEVIDEKLDNLKLHFQSEMAPELRSFSKFGKVTNCTIFVPKDANITSYYANFNGNGNKIIQE